MQQRAVAYVCNKRETAFGMRDAVRLLTFFFACALCCPFHPSLQDRALFEMHQAQLEKFTDELHGQSAAGCAMRERERQHMRPHLV